MGVLINNNEASAATAGLQPVSRSPCPFHPAPLVAVIAPTPPGKKNMSETAAIPPSAASPQWEEGREGCQQCNGLAEAIFTRQRSHAVQSCRLLVPARTEIYMSTNPCRVRTCGTAFRIMNHLRGK